MWLSSILAAVFVCAALSAAVAMPMPDAAIEIVPGLEAGGSGGMGGELVSPDAWVDGGLGDISLLPGADGGDSVGDGENAGVETEAGETGEDETGGADETGAGDPGAAGEEAPSDRENGGGSLSDLLGESDDFDSADWLDGFDPDASFGGLGLEEETGPGVVTIKVLDTDGAPIEGLTVTEDGFRTDRTTDADGVCVIEQIPYGQTVYGIYLTYSLDIESAAVIKHEIRPGGAETLVRENVADPARLPPVDITDGTPEWEISFVVSQSMRIRVDYYTVSPNDRFYSLFSDDELAALTDGAPPGAGVDPAAAALRHINTFAGMPVRVAVYVEMPSLMNISRIRLSGEGLGGEPDADAAAWLIDPAYGEYSMPDLTPADPSWQLVSADTELGGTESGGSGSRFFVATLPSAYEGARLRLADIAVTLADGSELLFTNGDPAACAVRLVAAPRLQ